MAQLRDLIVNGSSSLVGSVQLSTINAPTSAGGTTYGPGTNGNALLSNGSSVYWGTITGGVSGVKGNSETTYRTGDVNITATNLLGSTAIGSTTLPIYWSGSAFTAVSANSVLTNLSTTSGASIYAASPRPGVTGTLGPANGGTGKTSLQDAANAMINALGTGSSVVAGGDYLITQYVNGGTTTVTYHRRAATAVRVGGLTTARTFDGISFDGTANVTRYGACSTGVSTAAKTVSVTAGTFNLEAGARVVVKFTAGQNTANNPTLNVNSKGAKNIFHRGTQITSGSNKGLLQGVCDFVYDGTQWHLVGNYENTLPPVTSVANKTGDVTLGTLTIGDVTYDGSTSATVSIADLGIASTTTFWGMTSTNLSDGSTTTTVNITVGPTTGNRTVTASDNGVVVMEADSGEEYIWTGSKWNAMGLASSYALASHTHGNINNGGIISSDTTAASGQHLVVTDSSNKVSRSSLTFGSDTNKFLCNNGSWATVNAVTSVSNAWTNGTTAGPAISTTVSGITGATAEIPAASTTCSGIITTQTQYIAGAKCFINSPAIQMSSSNDNRTLTYLNSNGNNMGSIFMGTEATNSIFHGKYFLFRQSSYDSTSGALSTAGSEYYRLPEVTSDRSTTITYNILTTKTAGETVYYIVGPSTDSAGVWTGTDSRITSYYDGLTILYVPGQAGGSSSTTLNINGLGAVQCYTTNTSALTTHYSAGTPILLTYSNSKWRRADYNSNTNTLQRTWRSNVNIELPITGISTSSSSTATTYAAINSLSYKDVYAAIPETTANIATLNPSTGRITVPSGIKLGSLIGSSTAIYGDTLPESGEEGQIFFQTSDGSIAITNKVAKTGDTMTGGLVLDVVGDYPIILGPWGGTYGTIGQGQLWYCGTDATQSGYQANAFYFGSTGNQKIVASQIYGSVQNDYAEFRQADTIEPGRVIKENGNDTLSLTTKRLERGCEIISDTFGFAIGETEKAKTPIAVAGRVLAYPYESIEEFKAHIGWPVCSGPEGTVSIMTEEEEEKYSSRIIGTISAIPDYDIWYGGVNGDMPIEVKGRIWIKVK